MGGVIDYAIVTKTMPIRQINMAISYYDIDYSLKTTAR
jgi:hypothetical protein